MNMKSKKILVQTTIPPTDDDWSIARFSRLGSLLRERRDDYGNGLYEVVMRDREMPGRPDPVLSAIDESDFDLLWLLGVDAGNGLTEEDSAAVSRFWARGGGLFVTRDHMNLGSSVRSLTSVGGAHYFHGVNQDPDESKRRVDDPYTTSISWPNFHSGANGDFQEIEIVAPIHPVLINEESPTGSIWFLPSHPHEGGIGAPEGENARVVARGKSKITGVSFNIAVAFEPRGNRGPAIAHSTFHHFVDYNWDPRSGSPSFVSEPPGDAILRTPQALADTHRYVLNAAAWLANKTN